MAFTVMAWIVMGYIVMAYTVMAYESRRLAHLMNSKNSTTFMVISACLSCQPQVPL